LERNHNRGKKQRQNVGYFCTGNSPNVNNRPMGENSSNLDTLLLPSFSAEESRFKKNDLEQGIYRFRLAWSVQPVCTEKNLVSRKQFFLD
jgi:hypothetical protein